MERPWGRWTRLYQDEQVELRKLEIVEGGYCTLHYHTGQSNTFYVVAGTLVIRKHDDDLRLVDAPSLPYGLVHGEDVQPRVIHRFHAKTRVVAYELLVATGDEPLDPSDSVKLGEAGVGEPNP